LVASNKNPKAKEWRRRFGKRKLEAREKNSKKVGRGRVEKTVGKILKTKAKNDPNLGGGGGENR